MKVLEAMASDPWKKHKPIKIIAAFDIVIATFSIFYSGKTLLAVFGGLHNIGQKEDWLLVFLILFFTFGMHILQILFAMLLIRASKETSSTIPQAICIAKIWCISSATFLILLIIELYIGLTTFEYNSYKILFIVFGIGKVFWRIFTIYYVECFRVDLQKGIENGRRSTAQGDENLVPVFKMVVTSPENYNSDVTDTEAEAEVKEWSKP